MSGPLASRIRPVLTRVNRISSLGCVVLLFATMAFGPVARSLGWAGMDLLAPRYTWLHSLIVLPLVLSYAGLRLLPKPGADDPERPSN